MRFTNDSATTQGRSIENQYTNRSWHKKEHIWSFAMLLRSLYKVLNWKVKATANFFSSATAKSNKHMAPCQPVVLSWATLPVSAEVLPEAQCCKDLMHLEWLPYLPPWSCTRLPRRRCCCWQLQTPLLHTSSHGCKREDRDTMWTLPNACSGLRWITTILVLHHNRLPALPRKPVPRETVGCSTRICGWAGDNQLPLCGMSDACSEGNMHTYASFSPIVIQTFSF